MVPLDPMCKLEAEASALIADGLDGTKKAIVEVAKEAFQLLYGEFSTVPRISPSPRI